MVSSRWRSRTLVRSPGPAGRASPAGLGARPPVAQPSPSTLPRSNVAARVLVVMCGPPLPRSSAAHDAWVELFREQLDEDLDPFEVLEAVAFVVEEVEVAELLLRMREEARAEARIGEDPAENALDDLLRHLVHRAVRSALHCSPHATCAGGRRRANVARNQPARRVAARGRPKGDSQDIANRPAPPWRRFSRRVAAAPASGARSPPRLRNRLRSGVERHTARAEAELVEPEAERALPQAEHAGGLALITLGEGQRLHEDLPLEVLELDPAGRDGDGHSGAPAARIRIIMVGR